MNQKKNAENTVEQLLEIKPGSDLKIIVKPLGPSQEELDATLVRLTKEQSPPQMRWLILTDS